MVKLLKKYLWRSFYCITFNVISELSQRFFQTLRLYHIYVWNKSGIRLCIMGVRSHTRLHICLKCFNVQKMAHLMSTIYYKACDVLHTSIVYYKRPKEIASKLIQFRFMIFFGKDQSCFNARRLMDQQIWN